MGFVQSVVKKMHGPFFFAEETVPGMTCLDILQLWLMTQLQNVPKIMPKQDGSPAQGSLAHPVYKM
jgi:hypothetical protein